MRLRTQLVQKTVGQPLGGANYKSTTRMVYNKTRDARGGEATRGHLSHQRSAAPQSAGGECGVAREDWPDVSREESLQTAVSRLRVRSRPILFASYNTTLTLTMTSPSSRSRRPSRSLYSIDYSREAFKVRLSKSADAGGSFEQCRPARSDIVFLN